MTKPTLLVLAAGMGSRYGGLKQIEPLGPAGETMVDYSVYDALRAGFGKLVFVIRRDIERPFKEVVGHRFETRLEVDYVYQEVPSGREKPWGTGQAVLAAREAVQEPFAVINADDFYGRRSFRLLAEHFQTGTAELALVGFVLKNTLSEFGSVARGVCQTTPDGYLETVVERVGIGRDIQTGVIHYTDSSGQLHPLSGDEFVSLNTWGFTPAIFLDLEEQFTLFRKTASPRGEFYIPTAVNSLLLESKARVRVLPTPDSWLGVTYKEDRPRVIAGIHALVDKGEYPERLWS
jgi:NDP-sugar pyrophosphorylase family protein